MSADKHAILRELAARGPRKFCEELGLKHSGTERNKFVCPRCGGSDPLSVRLGRDETIQVKCFGCCDLAGDAFTLIAEVHGLDPKRDFQKAVAIGAQIAGLPFDPSARPVPSSPRPEPLAPEPPKRIPIEEVHPYWDACENPAEDAACAEYLRGRGLDPETLVRLDLVRSIPLDGAPKFEWASWSNRYHLAASVYDADGRLAGLRAWRIAGNGPKRIAPKGFSTTGLVLADARGQAMLRGDAEPHTVIVTEGEPDFLSAVLVYASSESEAPAILGMGSGWWTDEIAARVPTGARVVIATDADPAGNKYAREIAKTLWTRCTVVRARWTGSRDMNDILRDDGPEALRTLLDGAEEAMSPPVEAAAGSGGDYPAEWDEMGECADPASEEPRATGEPLKVYIGGPISAGVETLCNVIGKCKDLYQRNGQLVHVVRVAETERDAQQSVGTPTIRKVQSATLHTALGRVASLTKGKPAKEGPAKRELLSAVLERGEWPNVRPLKGIIECPTLLPNGQVLQTPGYEPTTGYLYLPNEDFPCVLEAPTLDDARKALRDLEEIFVDFPLESDAHKAAAIAAILTLVARPGIRGSVPCVVWSANAPGVGKTLGADACVMTATGRIAAKMGFPANEEELEKVMGAYALSGASVIQFDNVNLPFKGAALDRCITSGGTVELRILGKSETPKMPWTAFIMATGNNVEIGGDIARRVLFVRLATPVERPEEREGFRHPNLIPWVKEERPRLVCAALTLLRAFIVAGKPDVGIKPWGSFEEWTSLVARAIVWAGGANCLATRPAESDGSDPRRMAMAAFMRGLLKLEPHGRGFGVKALITQLYPLARGGALPPDGHDEMREAIEILVPTKPNDAPDPTKLGHVLRTYKGRPLGGLTLVSTTVSNLARWSVKTTDRGDEGDEGDPQPSRKKRSEKEDQRRGEESLRGEKHPLHPLHPLDLVTPSELAATESPAPQQSHALGRPWMP